MLVRFFAAVPLGMQQVASEADAMSIGLQVLLATLAGALLVAVYKAGGHVTKFQEDIVQVKSLAAAANADLKALGEAQRELATQVGRLSDEISRMRDRYVERDRLALWIERLRAANQGMVVPDFDDGA